MKFTEKNVSISLSGRITVLKMSGLSQDSLLNCLSFNFRCINNIEYCRLDPRDFKRRYRCLQ